MSRHVVGESSKLKLPIKAPQSLKREFQDDVDAPLKRAKVPKKAQFSQHDGYDADDSASSASSTSPLDRHSTTRRKSLGPRAVITGFDYPMQTSRVSWWRKPKDNELEDGKRSLTVRADAPVQTPKVIKRKSDDLEDGERSTPISRALAPVHTPRVTKRKYNDLEDGKRSPTEVYQHLVAGPMKRYSLSKKFKKGGTAGLTTPLGDMCHLPY
jgi:hypothetical protein